MAYKLVPTDEFNEDYQAVFDRIMEDYRSPNAALRFEDAVDHALRILVDFPAINAVSAKPVFHERGIREQIVLSYVITYEMVGEDIVLHNIYHQRQDFGIHD